jgi:hypothetical protein
MVINVAGKITSASSFIIISTNNSQSDLLHCGTQVMWKLGEVLQRSSLSEDERIVGKKKLQSFDPKCLARREEVNIDLLCSRPLFLRNVVSANLVERIDDGVWACQRMAKNSKLDLGGELGERSVWELHRTAGGSSARLEDEIDRRLAGDLVRCQKCLQSLDLIEVVPVFLLEGIIATRGQGSGGIGAFHHADLVADFD